MSRAFALRHTCHVVPATEQLDITPGSGSCGKLPRGTTRLLLSYCPAQRPTAAYMWDVSRCIVMKKKARAAKAFSQSTNYLCAHSDTKSGQSSSILRWGDEGTFPVLQLSFSPSFQPFLVLSLSLMMHLAVAMLLDLLGSVIPPQAATPRCTSHSDARWQIDAPSHPTISALLSELTVCFPK